MKSKKGYALPIAAGLCIVGGLMIAGGILNLLTPAGSALPFIAIGNVGSGIGLLGLAALVDLLASIEYNTRRDDHSPEDTEPDTGE